MSSQRITLASPLSLGHSFRFPLQSPVSRREVVIGGLLLLIPVVGWILNMGHRIAMTHNMIHGQPAWPAWKNYSVLWKDGCVTLLGMVLYHLPALVMELCACWLQVPVLHVVAVVAWLLASIAVPGYMTHYCVNRDPSEIFNPFKAMRRVWQAGPAYWHAWLIALLAMLLSFAGLAVLGIGFLFTSVWFWQVAGFSFATQFSQRFALQRRSGER